MKTCYIISAGDADKIEIIKNDGDYIIACDGGLEHCKRNDIAPDLVIGDFDSLGYIPADKNTLVLPVEKDDTDTAFAVKYAMEKGFERFVIFGGAGGKRADHTFANIALLAYVSKNGGTAYLDCGDYSITAVTDAKITFREGLQGDISVFSLDEKAVGVYEKGLKYTLYDGVLENSNPMGVSNSFTGQESTVAVRKGTLIIYFNGKICDTAIDKFSECDIL
ncbi:MAG: thiamine diphosphokinase [Clostridia bacterium]|nr:thiamine diphosphokinase [Clostridia bacterium]